MKCLADPISVEGQSVVNCNKKYCTILRQELKVSNAYELCVWELGDIRNHCVEI